MPLAPRAMTVETMTPSGLRELAGRIARRQTQAAHWSVVAAIIGRVDDERLWETFYQGAAAYPNTAAWAEEELGLTRLELVQHLDLYYLMRTAAQQTPAMTADDWLAVSRSLAPLLKKIAGAGGTVKTWRDRVAGRTVERARAMITDAIGQDEAFVTRRIRVPVSMEAEIDAALALAAERNPDLEITDHFDDPKNAFRLLHRVFAEWVQLPSLEHALASAHTKLERLLKAAQQPVSP